MKATSLILLSFTLAIVSVLGFCYLGNLYLGDEAKFPVFFASMLIGVSSRRIVEKILGYTLLEAYQEDQDGKN